MIIYKLITFDLDTSGEDSDYIMGMYSTREKAERAYENYAKYMDSYATDEYPIEEGDSYKETHGFIITEHELDYAMWEKEQ